ncbi:MAG: hypothetical protein AAGE52_26805 [Myxococcota bacterium]
MPSPEHRLATLPSIDWGPWLVAALLLGGSIAYARGFAPEERHARAFDGHVLFDLPHGWSAHQESDAFVAQLPTLDAIAPTVLVEPIETDTTDALFQDLEVARMQQSRASGGIGYRVLHVDERDALGGHRSTWVWYAIVRDPPDARPGAAVMPIVVVGVDILVITAEGHAWHVAAFEPEHESADDEQELRRIVDGLRFR